MLKVALSILSLLLAACSDSGDLGPGPSVEADVVRFVDLMNDHRASVGCPPLSWNDGVAAVAQAHSQDMVDRGFFSHTNPDGESPFDRLTEAGIAYSRAAENIAWGHPTADAVLSAWLGSPGHRANIENCLLTQHGVGLQDQRWTHVFITP